MPAMVMDHVIDPKEKLLSAIGDLSDIEVMANQVLVAIYVRPEKTKSGIIMTDNYRDEDRFQGKVGLIVKTGPSAFHDPDGTWFGTADLKVGDWIAYRASDGWPIAVNKTECRMLRDDAIRLRISHPDKIW